jgi:hypothetical protein
MLLAFFKAKKYPKLPDGLDTEVGWLVFALLVCLAIWAWSRSAWIRRALFAGEDPRVFAALRVMLAVSTVGMLWNLEPYWDMLWSDEGIFTLEEARQRLGRSALSGWSSEAGFFDGWAIVKFLWERPSLFLLHGSPEYVRTTMWAHFALLGLFAIGFRTRVTGLLCWFALNHVYGRNALYLEGTDTVYRCLWFLILFARTDRAWSVDNWLRVRRTRARSPDAKIDLGLLADRFMSISWALLLVWLVARELEAVHILQSAGPVRMALALAVVGSIAEAVLRVNPRFAEGTERYLMVARWPRVLMVVQYGYLYVTTGWVKSGGVWARGDALYYAMNMDHFYRFGGLTEWLSAYLGTNIYRLMTYVTHYWENLFAVVIVGMWLQFRWRYEGEAWAQEADASPVKRWVRRLALLGAYSSFGLIFHKSARFFFELNKSGDETMPTYVPQAIGWGWGVGVPAVALVVGLMAWWGPSLNLRLGRKKEDPPRISICFDREFFRRWLIGRRVWLTLGVIFHGILIFMMNIGWFPLIMLGGYLCFLNSAELLRALRLVTPARWRESECLAAPTHANPEDQEERYEAVQLEARGDALVDDRWILVWLGSGVALAAARAKPLFGFEERAELIYGLALVLALVGLGGVALKRNWGWTLAAVGLVFGALASGVGMHPEATELGSKEYGEAAGRALKAWGMFALAIGAWNLGRRRERPRERPHLMGNSLTRTIILCFCMWHTGAIGAKLMPNFPVWGTWQSPARRVFGAWLRNVKCTQSWRMFAPNPPRSNSFMKTVVIDGDGGYWDLRNNSLDSYPDPFIVNDRMRKMQRRMVGKGKWYLRYWAAYHCRLWELEHDQPAKEVQIYKVTTRIPPPKKSKNKPWNARKRKRTTSFVQRHKCDERGRPTIDQKQRRGIELDQADREREAKAAEKGLKQHETRTKAWARRKSFGGDGGQGAGDGTQAKLDTRSLQDPFKTRTAPARTPTPQRADPGQPPVGGGVPAQGVGTPARSHSGPTANEGQPATLGRPASAQESGSK